MVPFSALSRAIERIIDILLLLPLSICLGLRGFQLPLLERPRTRVASPGQHPTSGDIVLVNHASPIDALYLALCYSPTFVIPQDANLVQLSTLSAFSQIGCAPKIHGRLVSLDALRNLKRAPIVIFVEGCTTNGRGVLQLAMLEDLLSSVEEAYALGLRYSPDGRECCTVDPVWRHVLRMMASLSCRINGRVQKLSLAKSNLQGAIASLAGVPALRIGKDAGLRFAKDWDSMANGSSAKP